jgi:hypothetical protein
MLHRSVYIKILILAVLIGFSALALKPVQTIISQAITGIRTSLIDRLEILTGMQIRYSSIRPVFFNSFDIRNISFCKNENEILVISKARIYFSLRELLFGRKIVISEIQIDRPQLHLDIKRDNDIFEHFKSLSNSNSGKKLILQQITEFLPEKTNYRIRNFSFTLSSGESAVIADNMNIYITRNKNRVLLDTTAGLEIIYAGFFNRTVIIGTVLKVNGEYLTDLQEGRGEIAFSNLSLQEQNIKSGSEPFFKPLKAVSYIMQSAVKITENAETRKLFGLYPFTVKFSYKEKALSFSAIGEGNRNNYFAFFDTEKRKINAEINLSDFTPSSLLNRYDYRKDLKSLLDMAITGRLSLNYKNLKDFNYSVFLHSGNIIKALQKDAVFSDSFIIDAVGNNEYIAVNDLFINSSSNLTQNGFFQGIFDYTGKIKFSPLIPSGTISVNRFSFTGKENVNGIFNISAREKEIMISSENFSAGAFSPKTLDIYFYLFGSDISVTVSSLCNDEEKFFLDAILNKNTGFFDASVFFNSFHIVNIFEIFRPFVNFINFPAVTASYTNNILLDAEIFLSSDYSNYAYNAPSVILRNENILGKFSFSGTSHNLALTQGIFYFDQNELVLSVNADFSNPTDFDFTLNANYLDTSWNIKGQILDGTTLIIQDPNGFHAYGNRSGSGAISGYIEGNDFPVPANIYPAYIDFYAALRYNSNDFWSVDISHFRIKELNSRNGIVNFSVSGSADQDGANFKNIYYNDNIGFLSGSADFLWNTDFSFFNFNAGFTDAIKAGESYSIHGTLKNNAVDINASILNTRIDRFIKGNGAMLASADAKISWNSIDSFLTEINLSSFSARYRAKQVSAAVKILISNNDLLAENLKIDFAGLELIFPEFYLKPQEGTAGINTSIKGFMGKKKTESNIKFEASFNKVGSWTNIKQALNTITGKLQIENFQFGNISQKETVFIFSGNDGAFSVSGGVKDMLKVEMDKDGNFYASLSDPLPIRGSFSGVLKNLDFDAYSNDFYIDIASLWETASNPQENFYITGGYITGKMNVKGQVWNPEFYGTGKCTSLRLKVPRYIAEDIRTVPFEIYAQGYEMTFNPVEAISGAGKGNVNGWLHFENWAPKNIGLDISVPRESPVPYNIGIAGFHADGKASGQLDLSLDTNDDLLFIKGDLFMNNAEMVHVNINESPPANENLSNNNFNTIVELSITTGSMVEFFWPNKNSPILRVNPEMRTVFLISADIQAGHYSINSDINIRSGELYYLDRNFYIRRGNLTFNENEIQFNPMINVRAEIRERSDSGPVTIAMIIENQPLLGFVPRFEATPGLTQFEIYTILGQNFNSQSGESTDLAQRFLVATSTNLLAQIVSGSDILSQLNFVRQFERGIRSFLHLDMLNIRTRFFENAVITGASAFGTSPVDRNRAGNYFDNTTVFIGKYVGQDMFIQSTLALRYDENNASFGGIRFEPDIGVELQSPYINIRWDFFPDNPKNWWMNDHSITLIWRKSFK